MCSLLNVCTGEKWGEMCIAPIPNSPRQAVGAAWAFRTGDRVFQAEGDRALMLAVGRLQQGSGNHSGAREGKGRLSKGRYGAGRTQR